MKYFGDNINVHWWNPIKYIQPLQI